MTNGTMDDPLLDRLTHCDCISLLVDVLFDLDEAVKAMNGAGGARVEVQCEGLTIAAERTGGDGNNGKITVEVTKWD